MEETHYYLFGLTMAGISSKALKPNYAENKFKFNDGTELSNKEFSDGSGLEIYETAFRGFDPQIGRFWQIDPLCEFGFEFTPYSYANNNPIWFNDPLGLKADTGTNQVNLDPVVVVGRKKDCRTCSSPSPSSNIDPARMPPTTVVPQPGTPPGTQPGTQPRPIPILPVVAAAPVLTILATFWPKGGQEFPLNDESIFMTYPELRYTHEKFLRILPPPDPNDKRDPLYLVRSGPWPESMESLAHDAMQASNNGFPHGVSAWLKWRVSGTDKFKRSAKLLEVMRYFQVQRTGRSKDHYTVILPNPVTQEVANLFNSLFKPS